MSLVSRDLALHALYVSTSPEYSLRGDVGVIYPRCTLICPILAYLPTILSLIDLLGIK